MRRCDRRCRERQRRLAAKRAARKAKYRRRHRPGRQPLAVYRRLQAPREFTLMAEPSRGALLRFLNRLRGTVVRDRHPCRIDFLDTERMVADGTLLFRAELERCLRLTGFRVPVRCSPPRKSKVAEVLAQVGIYALLRQRHGPTPSAEDVVHWKVATGSGADGQHFDTILGHYDGVIPGTLLMGLYRALTEAMTNCHHHAYIARRPDGLGIQDARKDWWMFSQERDGTLMVVFCDLGVGIPATVPVKKPDVWARLLAVLGRRPTDAQVIEGAVRDSVSRTGKTYRGKGLNELVDVIRTTQGARLSLLSNRGLYAATPQQEKTHEYSGSILGTVISWAVPLPS